MSGAPAATRQLFDLARASDACVRAIVEGLELDREHVLRHELDPAAKTLTVELAGASSAAHVEGFVRGMLRAHKLLPSKVLKQHRAADLAVRDVDAELAASPDVQLLGAGLTGLRGPLLALFRFFEREFLALARDFDAEENHYPVLVPDEVLAEVGYLGHFPQHVTFCSHLPDSLPVLESVAAEAKAGPSDLATTIASQLAPPRHVLTPGVCLPCYRQQRGVVLAPGEVRTLTMQNHVFRYEGARFRPLARGWDFTVRDVVFFGAAADVERLRLAVIERVFALCCELDLAVTVELAHDPFFLDASRDKAVYQRLGEVKYELLFPLPQRGETLAASSFNLHRDFYTAVYDTRLASGELAESGCMGFGLERWVYGFLTQKGLDPGRWPERVRAQLA